MLQIYIHLKPFFFLPACINRCLGPCSDEVLGPWHKVSCITSGFFPLRSSVKDTNACHGGRARAHSSLETFYICLTKVICKQKRNPIENRLLHRGAAPCFSVPRACLITFKQHFQTAFWESCQRFSFLGKFSKQFGFAIFIFFDLNSSIIDASPHQALNPAPPHQAWRV